MPLSKSGVRRKGRRGVSLTETVLVMGVIGIVAIGIWAAASGLSNKRLLNQVSDQLGIITSNMRAYYSGQSINVNGLNVAAAMPRFIAAGIFPAEMVVDANNAANAWNGAVTMSTNSPSAGLPARFVISYYGIPADVCGSILSQNSLPGKDTGLVQINLKGSNAFPVVFLSDTSTHQLPIPPVTAINACSADPGPFRIDWVYILGNGCYPGAPC